MISQEQFSAFVNRLSGDIAQLEECEANAMLTIEQLKAERDEYNRACRTLAVNSYLMSFLTHILCVAETKDAKQTENLVRFHAYHQAKKSHNFESEWCSGFQSYVANTLNEYIELYFDIEQ